MAPPVNNSENGVSLMVYPNPTHDDLNIDFSKQVESVVITVSDMTGRLAYQQTVKQSHNTISLKGLPAGMYILRAVFPDHTSLTSKISVYGK